MTVYNLSLFNPLLLGGIFIGAMMAFVFCAMTMKAVGRAAGSMVDEVRRQFKEIPGILEGKATPEYAKCVAISTKGAQKEMVVPSMLAIFVPVLVGVLLGVAGVIGLLVGGLTAGFTLAVCLIMQVVHGIMQRNILKKETMVEKAQMLTKRCCW